MNWKRIFVETAVLLLAAGLMGAGTNALRPETHKLAWTPHVAPPPKDPGLMYLEIAPELALQLHRNGVLFIDARRSSLYEQGHIEKAINISVWEHDVDHRLAALLARGLPPDTPMVVYCSGGKCEEAVSLCGRLAVANFYNLYLYKSGFPEWQRRNWPITQGKKP